MRLINVDETYGIIASDNTDWTCTFSGGVITVADEDGFIHAEFLVDDGLHGSLPTAINRTGPKEGVQG